MNFKPVIGLETHVELNTKQKMFCGCDAHYFGAAPNTHTCPVCLGLPGALPVPNQEAIRWTILIGLALHCKINLQSYFERKHYFYPDLPKGYQISQYVKPLCYDGYLDIGDKRIRINRIHIEEDTGKLLHGQQMGEGNGVSYVDFNRSSVPLMEIVTEPDVHSDEDASAYLKKLQLIIQYLGASECDMEKGSMRCEPNISVAQVESLTSEIESLPPYKVEVKNINSFNFVRKAIQSEVTRHTELLKKGVTPTQETRRYMESTGKTEPMRSKEDSKDYRYFPEPDIPPMVFDQSYIDEIQKELDQKDSLEKREKTFAVTYKLRPDMLKILIEDRPLGDVFLSLVSKIDDTQKFASFLVNQRKTLDLKDSKKIIEAFKASTQKVAVDPAKIHSVIAEVVSKNEKAVVDYKAGKQNSFQFLLGQCLRTLGRGVDVPAVTRMLREHLG